MQISKRITIVKINRPIERNLNNDLQWIGNSLGLFGLRDKDKSCFRIFIELVKAAKANKPLSSDDIAFKLGLSRGTVIHHINKLMENGIVVREQNGYLLRVNKLSSLIKELELELRRYCSELRETAEEIDRIMGF